MRQGKGRIPPREVELSLSYLRALPLVEGERHHLKVVEGVIQFGTNRTWNDVIASYNT
jgi:hypothetical protein